MQPVGLAAACLASSSFLSARYLGAEAGSCNKGHQGRGVVCSCVVKQTVKTSKIRGRGCMCSGSACGWGYGLLPAL